MARMIEKYPARDDLKEKLRIVGTEIERARVRQSAMFGRIELARKKFFALGTLLKNLQIEQLIDPRLRQVCTPS
jgi:hypothetical protein